MTAQLAVTAVRTAVARRQPRGVVVVHSDRGSQFRARSFRAVLIAAGLQGSMGRVASAGDNAAMESWHALLQKNVLDRRRWRTRDELHGAIVFWIEHTYNRRRRQRGPRQAHPGRIRTRLHQSERRRCGMISPNRRQPKLQQSPETRNEWATATRARAIPRHAPRGGVSASFDGCSHTPLAQSGLPTAPSVTRTTPASRWACATVCTEAGRAPDRTARDHLDVSDGPMAVGSLRRLPVSASVAFDDVLPLPSLDLVINALCQAVDDDVAGEGLQP